MARTVARGFICAAGTPVALACVAATIFVGGNLVALPFAWLYAGFIALPISSIAVLVFGLPLYFVYRRLRITSLRAYIAAGFVLSIAVTAFALWSEYAGGYENAGQALLEHVAQLVSLISGPAAAAMFWRAVRPDLRQAGLSGVPAAVQPTISSGWTTPRPISRFQRRAVEIALVAMIAFLAYGTFAPRNYPQPLRPLAGEELAFDSTKAPDLVVSLKSYASAHSARLGYYFMSTHPPKDFPGTMPPVLLMANLTFDAGIKVSVLNPNKKGLQAYIYSDTNKSSDQSDRIWSEFVAFLQPAVAHANALSVGEVPDVPWHGEGGKLETKWWDWRFRRE
jgi:hypothetical protein